MARPLLTSLVLLACASGCTELPDLLLGGCGNGVVEPALGEECDSRAATCGAPSTSGACRLTCATSIGVFCPSGMVCGIDRVCRTPRGTYAFGPAIGGAGDQYTIVDVTADGFPDIIDRGRSQVTLYKNDGSGGFTQLAAGASRANALGTPLAAVAVAGASTTTGSLPSSTPLVVAATADQLDVMEIRPSGAITPAIVGSSIIDETAPFFSPLGAIDVSGTSALVYVPRGTVNDAAIALVAPVNDLTRGTLVPPLVHLDTSSAPCNFTPPFDLRGTTTHAPSQPIVLFVNYHNELPAELCATSPANVISLNQQRLSLDGHPLDVAAPVFGDFDGDGLADVIARVLDGGVLVWRNSGTIFLPPLFVPLPRAAQGSGSELTAGDVDGDGHADLVVTNGEVLLNRTAADGGTNADAGFDEGGKLEVLGTAPPAELVGDFNRDRLGDAVRWDGTSDVLACSGDGTGVRFGCDALRLPRAVSAIRIGDINGDLTDDLLAVGATLVGGGGGVSVVLGRPLQFPAPDLLDAALPAGELRFADLISGDGLASRVLAAIELNPVPPATTLLRELAVGYAGADGVVQFGFPIQQLQDVRVVDENGDDRADFLAVASTGDLLVLHGAARLDLATGARFLKNPVPFTGRFRFVQWPGDPLPAAVGLGDGGLWVEHLRGGKLEAHPAPLTLASDAAHVSFDVVDLDGDGVLELVLAGSTAESCQITIGRFVTQDLPRLTTTTLPQPCFHEPGDLTFVDLPGILGMPDGKLELLVQLAGASGASSQAFALDRDDHLVPGPNVSFASFHDENGDPVALVEPFYRWLATIDVNGDGLTDLVYATPKGVQIAFAEVVRK